MHQLVVAMKWIMLASGLLTFTMVYAAIAPQAALQSSFGETLEGPVADIVVRSWGALIALVGAMLVYGAFHVPSRPLVLVVASLSKVVFVALVLSHGARFLGEQVGAAVIVDGDGRAVCRLAHRDSWPVSRLSTARTAALPPAFDGRRAPARSNSATAAA